MEDCVRRGNENNKYRNQTGDILTFHGYFRHLFLKLKCATKPAMLLSIAATAFPQELRKRLRARKVLILRRSMSPLVLESDTTRSADSPSDDLMRCRRSCKYYG